MAMNDQATQEIEDVLTEIARQMLDQGVGSGSFGQWGCSTISVEICPDRVNAVIDAGACRLAVPSSAGASLSNVSGFIDHTLLKPDATIADIDDLCSDALEYSFASVCVNGIHVRRCAEILGGSTVKVCTVVGFPLGAVAPEVKLYETRRAIEDGAHEIDMVMNIGALKSGDDDFVRRDIAGLAQLCHRMGAKLKVILETCLLTDVEKRRACELCKEAGADFVKTSTGFGPSSATPEIVDVMVKTVGGKMGIKASGGIRTWEQAVGYLEQGATRLGIGATQTVLDGGVSAEKY